MNPTQREKVPCQALLGMPSSLFQSKILWQSGGSASYGRAAIQAALLLNGAASVALFACLGNSRFTTPFMEQLAYGKDLKGGTVPGLALVPGIIAFAGGLPIMTEDKVQIGAIGVSGGTADQDETCAQDGIEAAKDALK
jgi:uncharacterized protein GlcG (DUF336 family)